MMNKNESLIQRATKEFLLVISLTLEHIGCLIIVKINDGLHKFYFLRREI